MPYLTIVEGPEQGRQFTIPDNDVLIGRQVDADIRLEDSAVSRHHARLYRQGDDFFLIDLQSSNGTSINQMRIRPNQPERLTEGDRIGIGPYVLSFSVSPLPVPSDKTMYIREVVNATKLDDSIYTENPAHKLQALFDLTQSLARTLDVGCLIDRLLEQLMRLFPNADRALVLLTERERLVVRGQRVRNESENGTQPYSRTVVQKALEKGEAILSEDVQQDDRFDSSSTIASLKLHSLMCVPLISPDGRRLGVVQVDRFQPGHPFATGDLQLLTTICYQAAIALDNAHLHQELLKEERLRQELQLANRIQQGYLPDDWHDTRSQGFEILARVFPARVVSGDFYDYCLLDDGRIAFFVGDVSGKGMPASLHTVAVHTLTRHIIQSSRSPAETLEKLNEGLSGEQLSGRFITMVHGIYDPSSGRMRIASAGHPPPLLRRAEGTVEVIECNGGRPIGIEGIRVEASDAELQIQVGDTLAVYTDGIIEARSPTTRELFGQNRLVKLLQSFDPNTPLTEWIQLCRLKVTRFSHSEEFQDDLTLLLLRRVAPEEPLLYEASQTDRSLT